MPLGPGETGHIGVRVAPERPVGLFKEYWRDEDATADSVRGDFYDTGDTAYTDDDGYLWFVGRADDVITSSAVPHRPVRGRVRARRASAPSPRPRSSASPTGSAARS